MTQTLAGIRVVAAGDALLDERRWLWRHVAKLLHRRLTLAMSVVRDISIAPLSQRIARRLLGQAMSGGSDIAGDKKIELRITQTTPR